MTADLYANLAQFYDLEIGGFDADLDLYRGFAARAGGPILEIGVGTGRVALELAAAGHEVAGIDASAAMLALARKRAVERRVSLELHELDMCDFDLGRRFALVFCALGGFRHLLSRDRQLAALRCVARCLAPDGVFVLDLPAWHAISWEQGPPQVLYDWTRYDEATGRTITKFNILQPDPANQLQLLTMLYDAQDGDGIVRRTTVEAPLYTFTRPELELLMHEAGLYIANWYGSFDLDPYDSSSPELIAVARRKEG